MAQKEFEVHLSLLRNRLRDAALDDRGAVIATPVDGQIRFEDSHLEVWKEGRWHPYGRLSDEESVAEIWTYLKGLKALVPEPTYFSRVAVFEDEAHTSPGMMKSVPSSVFITCDWTVLADTSGISLATTGGLMLGTTCVRVEFVRKAGDTMTGPLILSEEPTPASPALQAAPKQWVLDQIAAGAGVRAFTLEFVQVGNDLRAQLPVVPVEPPDMSLWLDDVKVASGLRREADGRYYFYMGLPMAGTYITAVARVTMQGV